ncbi:MAG: hypothetical protein SNH16_03345 [Rikenellaceae bacterium]
MKITKSIIAAIALVTMTVAGSYAQPNRSNSEGGRPQQPKQGMQQKGPKQGSRDIVAATGYFTLDAKSIVEALELKSKSTVSSLNSLIAAYNKECEAIGVKYADQIAILTESKAKMEAAKTAEKQEEMKCIAKSVMEQASLVRPAAIIMHKNLVEGLKDVLTVNEFEKWNKVYGGICRTKSFNPRPQGRGGKQGGGKPGMNKPGQKGGMSQGKGQMRPQQGNMPQRPQPKCEDKECAEE